jgi:branched-chain amino acid transport system permease protein
VNTYIVPGLVVGCVYAIAASGIVLTYATSGVLNLAYGSMAFFNATLFYYLTAHGMGGWPAAAICVLGFSPLFGVLLWRILFRHMVGLGLVPALIASIGLAVALPALAEIIFRPEEILYARGIIVPGQDVHKFLGIQMSTDQLTAVVGALVIGVALFWLLRFTMVGLKMRAVFDNRPVAAQTGVSTNAISTISWGLTSCLAGLGGILLSPLLQLQGGAFLTLTVASLAAALVGGLRSISITFAAAIAIGVVSSVVAGLNTGDSLLSLGIQPSLPFIVMMVTLFFRRHPIDVGQPPKVLRMAQVGLRPFAASLPQLWPIAVILIATPLLFDTYWTGVVAQGLVYALIFLSFTVALGDAGMIPLGQSALVGIGGFLAGKLAADSGVALMLAVFIGGFAAAAVGAVVAYAGGRLGTLEFGFLTLAFGLFCDNFLFQWTKFVPVSGRDLEAPTLLGLTFDNETKQLYLFGAFLLLGMFIFWLFHRRVAAFAVNAGRMNVGVAEATGIAPRNGRVLALAIASFFAGLGGAMLGIFQLHLGTGDVTTATGLLWMAVVVLMGVRSPAGAVVAGLSIAVMPAIFNKVLPLRFGAVPTILFGLGGLALASDPRGLVSFHGDQLRSLAARLRRRPAAAEAAAVQ